LHPLVGFDAWLGASSEAPLRLLLAPDGDVTLGSLGAVPDGPVEILVGPEGGLTPEETSAALRRGFRAVRLGPRILRTDTAGPAVLAALNAQWGDWR
jgi:16S rRNA (uracil1498-N3)-methyltransferase